MLSALEAVEKYSAKNHSKILKTCEPLFAAFGIDAIYYNHVSNAGHLVSIGSHVDWMNCYYSGNLMEQNPFFKNPDYLQTGIHFLDYAQSENLIETRVLAEKKCRLSIVSVAVKKTNDDCIQLGLSTSKPSEKLKLMLINERDLLFGYFHYFESELSGLLGKAKADPVDLKGIYEPTFRPTSNLGKISLSDSARREFLEIIYGQERELFSVQLTQRERQCALLLIEDYSAKEIANELGLSIRTVEFYVENIRMKFGNVYRPQLREKLAKMKSAGRI